ncbi:MAG: MFS transporter, partial [Shimia sp.]
THSSFRAQIAAYPELLTSPRFWGYCAAAALSSGSFFSYLGGSPYVGTEVFGLSTALLGVYFGAPAIGYFAGNFISGRYSAQVGIDRMILWGSVICAGGLAVALGLALTGLSSALVFFGFMTFVGLGNGMVLPNATAGMLSVRPHLAGSASGLGGSLMLGGGALLSAFAGIILEGRGSEVPLLVLQVATSAGAILAILYVLRRKARDAVVPAAAE